MNDLTDRRREVLERGLAEFDAATRRRRTRAWAGRSLAAIAVVAACTVVVLRTVAPAVPALPRYVEVISGDLELSSELALAKACERVDRADGRLVVVECAFPAPPRRAW
jgi:hypothetical protein